MANLSEKLLTQILSLHDFESYAKSHLPRPIFGYISGGVEDGQSLRANREIFDRWQFHTRVLRDVSDRNQSIEIFGEKYLSPFGISPMGLADLTAYQGDLELARAAAKMEIPSVLSAFSLTRMEEVAQEAPRSWFQAYLPGDHEKIEKLVARVQTAGFKTLVLTVDIPVGANRENNVRTGFSTPLKPSVRLMLDGTLHPKWLVDTFLMTLVKKGVPHFENMFAERSIPILSSTLQSNKKNRDKLSWSHFDAIRQQWKGNLVIKGILSVNDARLCREHGADGLILSNHGGRQLDGSVSPMAILSAVVAAVPELPIMIDSGFRRGTDILKALGLGARMAFVGRPFNYALTLGGSVGVCHAISLLRDEIDRDMAMLGASSLAEVSQDIFTA